MQSPKKDKHFIKKPVYEGGLKAMRQFIRQHMRYPKSALDEGIEGTVLVKYSIDYQGVVVNTKVISSLGHGCDEEAIRLVKLLRFKVSKIRKGKILFHRSIQIHFHLPKTPVPKKTSTAVQYQFKPVKAKKAPVKPASKSYHYTVKLNH